MPWGNTHWREKQFPPGWESRIRPAVLKRDGYRCVAKMDSGARCPDRATDVDHINDPHDHSLANLRSLCSWHHANRTAAQGAAAALKDAAKFSHPWSQPKGPLK